MTEIHQQERRSDGSRTRTGCITCRIRKKKCDERRPACQTCLSRQLSCYGFNAPLPLWYTSKASWEEVRNSDEAKSLRTLAETRYKIFRKVGPNPNRTNTSTLPTQDHADRDQPCLSLQLRTSSLTNDVRISPAFAFLKSGVNIWQLRPETIWWDSKIRALVPDPSSSSHEETRLLMLFMDVIHPITHTFYRLGNSSDRSWMLDRLVSRPSLYCSAISISACFEHSLSQSPSIDDIGMCPKVRKLQNRAICDLRTEVDKFALMKTTPIEDFVWAGVQLLDVVIHLETLEIFSMFQGHWEMHHEAARKILNHVEVCSSAGRRNSNAKGSVIGDIILSLPPGNTRRRSLEFSVVNYIWIDILAISTFGLSSYSPCAFDYLDLLQSQVIKPEDIMGCQGWIIAIVLKIARLEQWKVLHQHQMQTVDLDAEMARQNNQIADELENGIKELESDLKDIKNTDLEEDTRLVSRIWAYGAQVLQKVIILGSGSNELEKLRDAVDICLQKLEALPTRLVMRITWPYTIAGSMASGESHQARFRWIVGKTMQEAQPPGISWKGLMIMEECWRLRRISGEMMVGWREAMESLGARVILT